MNEGFVKEKVWKNATEEFRLDWSKWFSRDFSNPSAFGHSGYKRYEQEVMMAMNEVLEES